MKNSILAAAAATTFLTSGAYGAITYVDADLASNTTLADGTAMVLVAGTGDLANPEDYYAPGDATIQPANNWGVRTRGDTNFGAVIVASEDNQHPGATDTPTLKTTVNVANGTYNVYVYFQGASWAPQAGLSSGSLTDMTTGSGLAVAGDFVDTTGMQFPGFGLYQTQLAGTATVTGGVLEVFVDDNGSNSTARTWYDGIGYEAVPEPSTFALLGLGALGFLRRRR